MTPRRRAWGAVFDAHRRAVLRARARARARRGRRRRQHIVARLRARARAGARCSVGRRARRARGRALSLSTVPARTWTLADPASRFQPDGVDGPSEIIDPTFAWTDAAYFPASAGVAASSTSCTVGTFTVEGTWRRRARGFSVSRASVSR